MSQDHLFLPLISEVPLVGKLHVERWLLHDVGQAGYALIDHRVAVPAHAHPPVIGDAPTHDGVETPAPEDLEDQLRKLKARLEKLETKQ